ncbi:hypothetical protein BUE76_23320 [Cnuella takakiae]|nr:hypothetical protein BUE76_23320 [Cnuella takakiae]
MHFKDEASLKSIGQKIRAARKQNGLTIAALAFKCGVDDSQIGRMERGETNFTILSLLQVAHHLSTDPKELLP